MKDFEKRIERLENSILLDEDKKGRCLRDSMILEMNEPIDYDWIMKMKRNNNLAIYEIPSFGGKHKIIIY